MTPRQFHDFATAAYKAAPTDAEKEFYEVAQDLNYHFGDVHKSAARPVQEAADEVGAAAQQLQQMLADLQNGWLWQLLTIQAAQNSDVSNVTSNPSDAT